MPSFTNMKQDHLPADRSLSDIFQGSDAETLLKQTRIANRNNVQEVLTHIIPSKICHLQAVLDESNDPASLLWIGHLQSGPFVQAELLFDKSIVRCKSPREYKHLPEEDVHSPTGVKDDGIEDSSDERNVTVWKGRLATNKICDQLMNLLEKECEDVIKMLRELQRWLVLEIPTIEDGNNFGVEVQDSIKKEILNVIQAAMTLHSLPRSHYTDRMRLGMTWCRYPNLEDHSAQFPLSKAAIASSDRYDHFLAQDGLGKLRTRLVGLLWQLQANWSKVHAPKDHLGTSNNMY